ncbi:hypothetical protein CPB84DRAFT_1745997 [Gymnopilus junonius]|uniref:Uncharacterized protein n=1 Tax=Gymnopilus junonius TaxID=109634 RepID=A0A9P5NSU3_GYMJU|nr:hypothetical protein CPB84DRAFT_1745997 [Gymnopilus junonius]
MPLVLLGAPQVHKLSLVGGPYELAGMVPYPLFGCQLTQFSCLLSVNFAETLMLFKACTNLIHCQIFIEDHVQPRGLNFSGRTFLPQLLSLSLLEGYLNLDESREFYSSIDTPHLKYIQYTPHNYVLRSLDPDAPPPIVTLIQRAPELSKLTITPRTFAPAALRKILEAASLTCFKHLVILQEPLDPSTRRRYESRSYFRVFDLRWLLVNADPGSESSVILPHLEVFDWSPGLVPDKTVLQFIIQRMNPLSASGVAALKRVRIMFARGQEIDILEEVK